MFFERLKLATHTLRFRLMVWNAIVVVLTAVGTLIGVREGLRYSLVDELDQLLAADLREIGLFLSEVHSPEFPTLKEELDRRARGHAKQGWFVEWLDAGGAEIWSSTNTPDPSPEIRTTRDFVPQTVGNYRLMQYHAPGPGGREMTVRIGAQLDFLADDIERIDRLVAVITGAVLIIAPLGGYWLAGRATRPLSQLIRVAARLRPQNVRERLPVRRTGDEIDRLSETVNGLLDRIAHYLEQKSDFLANAAHELRTPLAAIYSTVEVALNEDRSQEEYKDVLLEMLEVCASLQTLVNHLLLLAEADTEKLTGQGERVPLHDIVEKSVAMFQGAAEFRNIELQAHPIPIVDVRGNRQHLWQVVNNLIDNSLKFTPAGGKVSVQLQLDDTGRWALLRISDTGIGIPEIALPRIFERFYRVDQSRGREISGGGNGLGLSICKSIVAAHGGRIQVESRLGEGATFTITLPVLPKSKLNPGDG